MHYATIEKILRTTKKRISRKAVLALKEYLEKEALKISKEASVMSVKEKRKTILERDIVKAIKQRRITDYNE